MDKKPVKKTLGNHSYLDLLWLERHEVIYLNPYVIIVENSQTMTIYSTHSPEVAYQVKLNQSKNSFADF